MRYRIILCMLLACMMVLAPMLALREGVDFTPGILPPAPSPENKTMPDMPQIDTPEEDTPVQAQPAQSDQVYTPSENGFTLLDKASGKTFEVDARTFVRGALAAEMPPDFHPEALKAQAVAAHTYALYAKQMQRAAPDPALKGADLTADPEDFKSFTTEEAFFKRYGEYAGAYWNTLCEAADAVCDYVLLYDGEPALTAYHSMSSGTTEDASNVWTGSAAYLVPVESRGDTLAPDYRSEVELAAADLYNALRKALPDVQLGENAGEWLEVLERSDSGYVTDVRVGGQRLTGLQLRELLGLRSSDFTIETDGKIFRFTVLGYGHGVGLSQYGADYLARQGESFDEILAHYYPGTQLGLLRDAEESGS